uniref:Phospholipid scramblase n=1 Tax=Varanus komodoensis TaxID=61221 RepID=A0A8D2LMJ2_VARKO
KIVRKVPGELMLEGYYKHLIQKVAILHVALYQWSLDASQIMAITCSKYEIKNHMGQRVYFAVEENGFFDRNFCAPLRSFTMRITDNTGREVITVNRPLRCNSCWFPCYLQELEVQSPPGTTVGYVVQKWDPLLPKFTIRDASKEDILKIIGPYATCGCFGDVDFEVKSLNDMSTIGKISKYWSGFVNNIFTNTANFGIQVPADLDVKIKAVMIGACFLLPEHKLVCK